MKLQLPQKTIDLNLDFSISERVQYIKFLLENERITYQGEEIKLDLYFSITLHSHNTLILLDMIGYYLTKGYFTKEELLIEGNNLKLIKDTKKRNKRYREITKLIRNKGAIHNLQDNYVLSHNKHLEMKKGSIRHNTFSNMSYLDAINFGIDEIENEYSNE